MPKISFITGFRTSTLFVVVSQVTVLVLCTVYMIYQKKSLKKQKKTQSTSEQTPLIVTDDDVGYDSFSNGSEQLAVNDVQTAIGMTGHQRYFSSYTDI